METATPESHGPGWGHSLLQWTGNVNQGIASIFGKKEDAKLGVVQEVIIEHITPPASTPTSDVKVSPTKERQRFCFAKFNAKPLETQHLEDVHLGSSLTMQRHSLRRRQTLPNISNHSDLRKTPNGSQSSLPEFSLEEVSHHCDTTSLWIVLWNKVYDLTQFCQEHPGGTDIILENAGRDSTVAFIDVGHSRDALDMLRQYHIGNLREEDRIKRKRFDTT